MTQLMRLPAPPPPSRPNKRRFAEMDANHRPFHLSRQWGTKHRKHGDGGDQRPPKPSRPAKPSASDFRVPPPHPIRVTPIQSRNPSPERVANVPLPVEVPRKEPSPPRPASPSSQPHVQPDAPPPLVTPVTPETPREEHDLAGGIRKERQTFYLKAANAARGTVTMDVPKPPLRPSIQPPSLFYLISCGLLEFDLERGKYEDFEAQIQEWKFARNFMDRLFAAYGRFRIASHLVT